MKPVKSERNPGPSSSMYTTGVFGGTGVPEVDSLLNSRNKDSGRGVRISAEVKKMARKFFEDRKKAGPDLTPEKDWMKSLHKTLRQTNKHISSQDVHRWCKKYNWGPGMKEKPAAAAAASASPSTGSKRSSQSKTQSKGKKKKTREEAHEPPAVERVELENNGVERTLDLKKSCEEFGDLISKISVICRREPSFRAGLVLLKPLANLVARNNTKAILGDETREDLLAEEMGLPRNISIKREASETETGLEATDDEILLY